MIPPPQDAQPVEPCFGQCGIADLKATLAHLTAERQDRDAAVIAACAGYLRSNYPDEGEEFAQALEQQAWGPILDDVLALPKGPTP